MKESDKPRADLALKMNTVAEMKINSRICRELFPEEIHNPITTGELLFLIRSGRLLGLNPEEMKNAGNWWVWARGLFIPNTMTDPMKKTMGLMALEAARSRQSIHFITARSPEFVHAQVPGKGDPNLPRSRVALRIFSEILEQSSRLLPTQGTILLADVAIDNLAVILSFQPDLEGVIKKNLQMLTVIVVEERLFSGIPIQFQRMSSVAHPSGSSLGELINQDGSVNVDLQFSQHAERLIDIATRESVASHQRMFGWNEEESKAHNRKIAQTMALVGQAVKTIDPPTILVHNEAFISRGALNNLLNDPRDPLPVVCLNTLLERKKIAKG